MPQLRSGRLVLPPLPFHVSLRRVFKKKRAPRGLARALARRARDPTLTKVGWRQFCTTAIGTRALRACDTASICRGFEERHMPDAYVYGKILCSFVWDFWNIGDTTHQSTCHCYLSNWSEEPGNFEQWHRVLQNNLYWRIRDT
jgi:hypothetical protein